MLWQNQDELEPIFNIIWREYSPDLGQCGYNDSASDHIKKSLRGALTNEKLNGIRTFVFIQPLYH